MNRKILLSVLAIAVTVALAGIATYALFNSTVSSTGNQFVAGTMNLTVNGATQLDQLNFANLTPGWTQTKTYLLHNNGNVQGRGQVFLQNFSDAGLLSNDTTVTVTEDDAEVYSGSLRSVDGRLGVLLTQEMLLRHRELAPEMLRRIAEYLGVTPE